MFLKKIVELSGEQQTMPKMLIWSLAMNYERIQCWRTELWGWMNYESCFTMSTLTVTQALVPRWRTEPKKRLNLQLEPKQQRWINTVLSLHHAVCAGPYCHEIIAGSTVWFVIPLNRSSFIFVASTSLQSCPLVACGLEVPSLVYKSEFLWQ